jgi:hypothetical protein
MTWLIPQKITARTRRLGSSFWARTAGRIESSAKSVKPRIWKQNGGFLSSEVGEHRFDQIRVDEMIPRAAFRR